MQKNDEKMADDKKGENAPTTIFDKLPPVKNRDYWGDSEISLIDTEKNVETFEPKEGHEWRQQGPYLICDSCPLQHATRIGMNKQMVGFDKNGKPILKRLNIGGR